ncbi:MAG TPA: MqnA/MqnD/SBP family protein [Spirochaetia bacterium]|nr:MqnA/MqnD/SBP family protein [Spirochaetia bacterium]
MELKVRLRKNVMALGVTTLFLLVGASLFAAGAREAVSNKNNTPSPAGAEAVNLRVATLRGPTGMGMIRLIDQAPRVTDGVSATYELIGTPELMVSRILSGEVDIASLPLNIAAKLYNSGVEYQLAAVNVLGVLYLVSDGVPVEKLSDLKGKTVYLTGKGANPDILMRYVLSENGLRPDRDVELNFNYDQVELASMMVAGRVKLALLPEPFVTQVLERNPNARVALRFEDVWKKTVGGTTPLAQGCLVVSRRAAQNHPRAVAAFLSRYRDSVDWVNADPKAAGILIEKHGMGLKASAAADAVPRMSLVYEPAEKAREAVAAFLGVLLKFSPASIGGKLPDSGFYLQQ